LGAQRVDGDNEIGHIGDRVEKCDDHGAFVALLGDRDLSNTTPLPWSTYAIAIRAAPCRDGNRSALPPSAIARRRLPGLRPRSHVSIEVSNPSSVNAGRV
jgi:hypothetical protein